MISYNSEQKNKVKYSVPVMQEETGGWKRLFNEEVYNKHPMTNIINMHYNQAGQNRQRMQCMWDQNAHKI